MSLTRAKLIAETCLKYDIFESKASLYKTLLCATYLAWHLF